MMGGILALSFGWNVVVIVGLAIVAIVMFTLAIIAKCYRKVSQGEALIRNGWRGTKVSFSGMVVLPVVHRVEFMDISVKRIAIDRRGEQGLVCMDNLRADIQVAYFVRVNNTVQDVMKVAQALGCVRASDVKALYELFDAKFSEALKSVGKRFDFTDLYTERVRFKEEILQIIGTDLNGYVLEDAAIDYLEQTDKALLSPDNILDAEGIKKITVLTAAQFEQANDREREKDMTIRKQDVEAREAILELNRQLAEAEAKQQREIAAVQAREEAEARRIQEEEREKAEKARIGAEEEISVAEENKQRQVIVAARNKERTDGVETERVKRDQQLELTERERLVALAQLEKDKAVEGEKKEVQLVVRERVIVEKAVVTEEERIKDTREFATADRSKRVQITKAEEVAEQALVKDIKEAEASKRAAAEYAEQKLIEADANVKATDKNSEAIKTLAEATVKEKAVIGVAEAEVMQAKAAAFEKQGTAEANVMTMKYQAEATGTEKTGTAEATVMGLKYHAEAEGINEKAAAMKIFDAVGKDHEEFKLRLNKDKEVELAAIRIQKDIAEQQAILVGEALKTAKIDIVGGDNQFFDRLVNSITTGKSIDRMVGNSEVLGDVRNTFLGSDAEDTAKNIKRFASQFGLGSEDVKNLTISALVMQMIGMAAGKKKGTLQGLLDAAKSLGIGNRPARDLDDMV